MYEFVYKVKTFLLEYLKDQKTEDHSLQYIICQQSQSMYWFHYISFSLETHFLFDRLEGTKVVKCLQCKNVKTLHELWHGQCCIHSPTSQNVVTVEIYSWCKNVYGLWNAEKLQTKKVTIMIKDITFLITNLTFLVNKKIIILIYIYNYKKALAKRGYK